MRTVVAFIEGAVELASIAVFLTVTIGWLALAAGHVPL